MMAPNPNRVFQREQPPGDGSGRPECSISGVKRTRAAQHPAAEKPRYQRSRDLPRLISVWPGEIDALDDAGHRALIAKIERALRAERQRGIGGHWTYDLARHSQLAEALRHERASLSERDTGA